MAQYGNMTLREREDKNKLKKRTEEKNQDSDSCSRDSLPSRRGRKPMYKNLARYKYDENGIDRETGLDTCDCLMEGCPGCWMSCPKCGSRKCGHDCRKFRRYKYDTIEIEGTCTVIKHKK